MSECPEVARPILEAIRAEVPRWNPKNIYFFFSFPSNVDGGLRNRERKCPMGCLRDATHRAPFEIFDLPGRDWSNSTIQLFGGWFDAFEDPREAIDAVWGPEKEES